MNNHEKIKEEIKKVLKYNSLSAPEIMLHLHRKKFTTTIKTLRTYLFQLEYSEEIFFEEVRNKHPKRKPTKIYSSYINNQ